MADDLPLAGLRIEGFRSFAPDLGQTISPLSKVHLLAGPNNAGKSNLLLVAQRVLPALANREQFQLEPSDRPYAMSRPRCGWPSHAAVQRTSCESAWALRSRPTSLCG